MRKYYMSHVDFSEIATVSTDEISKEIAISKLTESGAINEKGKPDANFLSTLCGSVSSPFFMKLHKRLSRRRGGIGGAYEILKKMHSAKEYTAMYLYIVIMYGFLEWQVPDLLVQLPAVPDALKMFMAEFIGDFEEFVNEIAIEEIQDENPAEDDSE